MEVSWAANCGAGAGSCDGPSDDTCDAWPVEAARGGNGVVLVGVYAWGGVTRWALTSYK